MYWHLLIHCIHCKKAWSSHSASNRDDWRTLTMVNVETCCVASQVTLPRSLLTGIKWLYNYCNGCWLCIQPLKGSVSRELTGVQSGVNRKVFLWGCVSRVVFIFLFRCHLLISIELSALYNRKKLDFFIKSWHVAVNLFSDMPMVYITLWR
jgi:hypothetical protein